MCDSIWVHANLVTMQGGAYSVIENGALAVKDGKILWIGPYDDLPQELFKNAKAVQDAQNQWITPGLIDCHTHIVHGGNRADEFQMRQEGATYEEIAKAGGGIISTVRATRQADEDTLYQAALPRLRALIREGVTGVEIKSGYGLDHKTEQRMLEVATRLRDDTGIRMQRTYLGAHAIPPEYQDDPDRYIDDICKIILPQIHGKKLIDAVDAFCETIAFTKEQIAHIFDKARELRLPVKLHAEQLSNQHGTEMAARYKALSADHLEYLDEDGVKAMADNNMVAVLLPGAYYFLKETQLPPIDLFRKYKIPMAIATDCNPGSSPAHSLLLMMNMACTLFGLTPEEALAGATINAAKALGWYDCGVLGVGMTADFAIYNIAHPAELSYRIGYNPCVGFARKGQFSG